MVDLPGVQIPHVAELQLPRFVAFVCSLALCRGGTLVRNQHRRLVAKRIRPAAVCFCHGGTRPRGVVHAPRRVAVLDRGIGVARFRDGVLSAAAIRSVCLVPLGLPNDHVLLVPLTDLSECVGFLVAVPGVARPHFERRDTELACVKRRASHLFERQAVVLHVVLKNRLHVQLIVAIGFGWPQWCVICVDHAPHPVWGMFPPSRRLWRDEDIEVICFPWPKLERRQVLVAFERRSSHVCIEPGRRKQTCHITASLETVVSLAHKTRDCRVTLMKAGVRDSTVWAVIHR